MTVLRLVPSCEKSAVIYLGPVKDRHTPYFIIYTELTAHLTQKYN